MIPLFKPCVPIIDLSKHSHLLNGSIVEEFTAEFRAAIQTPSIKALYCIPVNSCTNAIELVLRYLNSPHCKVPSMIPPVVLNAVIHAGSTYELRDNASWVGSLYALAETSTAIVVDSAQSFELAQFGLIKSLFYNKDIFLLHSFYPTKPIGGIDGGMISTDSEDAYKWLSAAVMNGSTAGVNSWEREWIFPGWKAYMSTAQAIVAMDSLINWPERSARVTWIKKKYDAAFRQYTASEHLYRVRVTDKVAFMNAMGSEGITTGVHYFPTHLMPAYKKDSDGDMFENTMEAFLHAVTIPMHYAMTDAEVDKVIKEVKPWILSE